MLVLLGVILVIAAIAGGAFVDPALFAIAILAVLVFFANRRRGAV